MSGVGRTSHSIIPLDMKGCICHFPKWQIHPFIFKVTILAETPTMEPSREFPTTQELDRGMVPPKTGHTREELALDWQKGTKRSLYGRLPANRRNWLNVGSLLGQLAQQRTNIGSIYRVCWELSLIFTASSSWLSWTEDFQFRSGQEWVTGPPPPVRLTGGRCWTASEGNRAYAGWMMGRRPQTLALH